MNYVLIHLLLHPFCLVDAGKTCLGGGGGEHHCSLPFYEFPNTSAGENPPQPVMETHHLKSVGK